MNGNKGFNPTIRKQTGIYPLVYITRKVDVFDEEKVATPPQHPPLKRFTELVEWSRTGPYSGYVRRRDPATGEEVIIYIKP